MEEILEDTEKNTQLVLKMRGESYPVRDCAIRTILSIHLLLVLVLALLRAILTATQNLTILPVV